MNKIRGIFMIIVATAGMGFLPFFSKVGFSNGFNAYTLILFRCMFAAAILVPYMRIKKIDYRIGKEFFWELAAVSFFCYGLMMLAVVSSYALIPTGIATTLHFIYPAAVLLGSTVFYREKLTLEKAAAVIIAMVGIFLLSVEKGSVALNLPGVILALLSGVLYAAYILRASHGRIREMNSFVLVYYLAVFNIFFIAAFAFATGNLNFDITYVGYADVLALSVLSIFVMALFKSGLNYVSSPTAAVLSTFEPLTSIVVGVLLLGESFTFRSGIGAAVIIAAVIFISFIEKKSEDKAVRAEGMQ
ncbi:Threonine/homoserine efflux transporter RhtA [Dethiosulfatibacter aminovorans DSM 17477]|uniref:Threonine/homoserine efflux transporter RhtA n=1 Tax=Dethiosulfatibacter aminovorans DSM 17477 TaxID=1121476 RepID=A0A1M6CEI9_9FIRM|nr:DMT family transporter [Dethiosulfatibacter aminovorans]SHI59396.1 Threonine/homoserine efflux transporter RhtA [Dethiosulfatibacter aminovorans DSM 17477]